MPLLINQLGSLYSRIYGSLPTDGVWRYVDKIAGVIFLCMVGAVVKWGWYGARKERYQIHQVKVALSSEEYLENLSRLVVKNEKATSAYSSSKIQNGAYEQLPPLAREKFKRLHLAAQTG